VRSQQAFQTRPNLSRAERYKQLAALLQQWEEEPGDYDERTWHYLEPLLQDCALVCREVDELTWRLETP
jgi:hypothetical protein